MQRAELGDLPIDQGSLRWLVDHYDASIEFKTLATRTRYVRQKLLDS
jgi:hypothetical protein